MSRSGTRLKSKYESRTGSLTRNHDLREIQKLTRSQKVTQAVDFVVESKRACRVCVVDRERLLLDLLDELQLRFGMGQQVSWTATVNGRVTVKFMTYSAVIYVVAAEKYFA